MHTTSQSKIFSLTDYGVLKVIGIDAKKFLQGQLTCNVEEITATTSHLAAHCNPQGRVLSLFYLSYFQDAYYLVMPKLMIDIAAAALGKYAVFYKVQLNNISEQSKVFGVMNTQAEANQFTTFITVSTTTHRYIIIDALQQTPFAATNTLTTMDWKRLNITEGIPQIYPETSGIFLPHEINLIELNAINFEKGCYTGQEIIARMHYRGKLKKHLYHGQIISSAMPWPGMDVEHHANHEGMSVGNVVDACQIQSGHYQALITIDETDARDNELYLSGDNDDFFQHLKLAVKT